MKNNHQEIHKYPEYKKLSKSGLIKCTAGVALVASIFFHSPGYSQTNKITEKDRTEQKEKKDSIIEGNWLYMDSTEYNNKVSQLITEINTYRKSKNLCELQPNPILNKAAQEYADYCIKNHRYCGHIDKEGNTPTVRCKKKGYTGCCVGENLIFCVPVGNEAIYVVEARKKSPLGHNELLINKISKYIGVGIIKFKNLDHIGYGYVIDMDI